MANKYEDAESRLNEYEVVKKIGNGRFGEVFLVKHKRSQEFFCWKAISYKGLKDREKSQLVIEVNVMRELKHPNIVRYVDRFLNKANQKLYILMEFCDAGDLARNIQKCYKMYGKIEEHAIVDIARQLLAALEYCHNLKGGPNGERVLHRDLKPQNIFLSTGIKHVGRIIPQATTNSSRPIAKIGDFGLSKNIGIESMAHSCVGTPYYWSPELLLHESKSYDDKSDMWALGCILYELCSGKTPFHRANNFAELVAELKKGPEFPLKGKSKELNCLVKSLLSLSPNNRPSARQCLGFQIIKQIDAQGTRQMQKCTNPQPGGHSAEAGAGASMGGKDRHRSSSCTGRGQAGAVRSERDGYAARLKEKQEMERIERENAQRKAAEMKMLERERLEKERAERERMERMKKMERERMEKMERERERERMEKMERERERERLEKLERERMEKMERERMEKMERERMEKMERERERERLEKLERERERERLEHLENERGRLEKERMYSNHMKRDRMGSERLDRDRERLDRDRERLDRDRERIERDRERSYYQRDMEGTTNRMSVRQNPRESTSRTCSVNRIRTHSKNLEEYGMPMKSKYDNAMNDKMNRYGGRKSTYEDSDEFTDRSDLNPFAKRNSVNPAVNRNSPRYSTNSSTRIGSNYHNGADPYGGYTNQSTISHYSNNSNDSLKPRPSTQFNATVVKRSHSPKEIFREPADPSYRGSKYEKRVGDSSTGSCKSSRVSNVYHSDHAKRSASGVPPSVTSRDGRDGRASLYQGATLREEPMYAAGAGRDRGHAQNVKDREYLLEQRKSLLERKNENYGVPRPNPNPNSAYDFSLIPKSERYEPLKNAERPMERVPSARKNRSSSVALNGPDRSNLNPYQMKGEYTYRNAEEYPPRHMTPSEMKQIPRNTKYEGGVYSCR